MTTANNKANVTVGKPKVSGYVYIAPADTAIPTDAKTALASAFKSLGYISKDGVTNALGRTTEDTEDWGGDIIMTAMTEKKETWKFKLVEYLNLDVQKFIHGAENVTGTLASMVTIKSADCDETPHVIVFEMILNGGYLQRVVLPCAYLAEVGDVQFIRGQAVGYDVTVKAASDETGTAHYKYIEKPAGE